MMKHIILNFFLQNKLELGLWLESERMLHPVIDEIGVSDSERSCKGRKKIKL